MKNFILSISTIFLFFSCGPAAEEKAKMMQSAKRTADSLAFVIKSSMDAAAEGAGYPNPPLPAQPATTAVPATSVSPTPMSAPIKTSG